MSALARLLTFLSPFRWRIALAILLGSLMIVSSIGLFGMAAYLIAAAALGPLLVFLSIPICLVQIMGILRAASRYAERLVSHNTTFRLLAHLRVWVYKRIEPQAPAHHSFAEAPQTIGVSSRDQDREPAGDGGQKPGNE